MIPLTTTSIILTLVRESGNNWNDEIQSIETISLFLLFSLFVQIDRVGCMGQAARNIMVECIIGSLVKDQGANKEALICY